MVLIPVLCPHCQSDQVIKVRNNQSRHTTLSLFISDNANCPSLFLCSQLVLSGAFASSQRANYRDGAQR